MDSHWNERLKESRKKRNITLEQLSSLINVSKQSLIQYEKGKIYPSLDVFYDICKRCNVSPMYIINGNAGDIFYEKSLQDEVLTLSLLLHSHKIAYDLENGIIKIINEELLERLNDAIWCLNELDINKISDLELFISAIKKI